MKIEEKEKYMGLFAGRAELDHETETGEVSRSGEWILYEPQKVD